MDDLLLISIKTKYANQIFNGTKKYEFRRKSIGEKNINKKNFHGFYPMKRAIIFWSQFATKKLRHVEENIKILEFLQNKVSQCLLQY